MITPKQLIEAAAEAGGVTVANLKSNRRTRAIVETRWTIFWLLVYGLDQNYCEAADFLSKDHSSVGHAINEAPKIFQTSKRFRTLFLKIHEAIKQIDRQGEPIFGDVAERISARARGETEVQALVEPQSDQAQEVARLRAGITEALRLMDTEPLMVRAMWMPIRDILTDAMEEK